jgi:hypothetical protein
MSKRDKGTRTSYTPKIFIILPCAKHAAESFRNGEISKPIDQSAVPNSARTVGEDRTCEICVHAGSAK